MDISSPYLPAPRPPPLRVFTPHALPYRQRRRGEGLLSVRSDPSNQHGQVLYLTHEKSMKRLKGSEEYCGHERSASNQIPKEGGKDGHDLQSGSPCVDRHNRSTSTFDSCLVAQLALLVYTSYIYLLSAPLQIGF